MTPLRGYIPYRGPGRPRIPVRAKRDICETIFWLSAATAVILPAGCELGRISIGAYTGLTGAVILVGIITGRKAGIFK